MSKAPARTKKTIKDRFKLETEARHLPRLFNIMALVSFLGAAAIVVGGLGLAFLDISEILYTRSVFILMIYLAITCGSTYAIGRLMRDHAHAQVSFFKKWLFFIVVVTVIAVFNLGLFY